MPEVVAELIVTVDGYAKGSQSPGYYGFFGQEFEEWLNKKNDQPHQIIIGRRTYEALCALPEKVRDEGWNKMISTPGWLYSRTLQTVDWPKLELIHSDVCEHVQKVKQFEGSEIRTLGSMSLVRQLIIADLVDRLRLIICPLVLPKTGLEPLFSDLPDIQFKLLNHIVLDGRIVILDYQPDGQPPYV